MSDMYGNYPRRPYGGVNDTGTSREDAIESIQEALGGKRREQTPGVADAGAVGDGKSWEGMLGYLARVLGSPMYRVGSVPEREAELAQMLGWSGEGSPYEFLADKAGPYMGGRTSKGNLALGDEVASQVMQRLLYDAGVSGL